MRLRAWLVVGTCSALVVGRAAAASSSGLPPPRFRPASGWVVLEHGRSGPALQARMSVAVTEADAATQRPFSPFMGFKRLRPNGLILWATTLGRAGSLYRFPHARWPLRLSKFRLDRGWEGQPAPNIQQRLRAVTVRGWNLDVRVYFATQRPGRKLVAKAQAELNRLQLPRSR